MSGIAGPSVPPPAGVAQAYGGETRSGAHARTWGTVAAVMFVGALTLLITAGRLQVLQADSYKAFYDGRWIIAHGIPHVNTLSHVQFGQVWVDGEWLAEVIFFEAWRAGGYGLAVIVASLSLTVTYMIVAWMLRRIGMSVMWTIALSCVALVGVVRWDYLRAQDLAAPLFAILVAVILVDSEHRLPGVRLMVLVPVLVLWANLHGSVILGSALAAAYMLWRAFTSARDRETELAAWCLAGAVLFGLAPLATPYGGQIVHYVLEFRNNPAQHIASSEGRSPAFPGIDFFFVYLPLVGVVAVLVRAVIKQEPVPAVLLGACCITGISAALRLGNLPWHAIVVALLAAEVLRASLPGNRWDIGWIPAAGLAVIALVVGALTLAHLHRRSDAQYETGTPLRVLAATVVAADTHPCWTILGDNLDSSALLWLYPRMAGRVAYDGRAELFDPAQMLRWATFEFGHGAAWAATTRGYPLIVAADAYSPALVGRVQRLGGAAPLDRDADGIAVINTAAARLPALRCTPGRA